jgi:hypothetical protein
MQLMSREDDPAPIILDVDMHVVSVKWNDNGSMLAVAGYQTSGDKTHNFIHFYSPWGEVCFLFFFLYRKSRENYLICFYSIYVR